MDSPRTRLGLLFLPTEVLLQVLLAIDEPWAIHHTSRFLLALSEDEHYLFLRDVNLPASLIVWNAIRRRGSRLCPEYLQRLLDYGAPVPLAFAQLLTNPRIPRPAPARALHGTLSALQPHTRALLVAAHMRTVDPEGEQGFIWDALIHDDDQRVFESLFGAPSGRSVIAPARALFDTRGFVPFCGGQTEAERGVGSLEGAFASAFESIARSESNSSLLSALLSSTTVCTLIATDERDLKSSILVNAFAVAGTTCAAYLMRHWAFWRPRLNVVDAILRLTVAETDVGSFIELVTLSSSLWPPSSCGSALGPTDAIPHYPNVSGADHTIESVARLLLNHINLYAQVPEGPVWFLKHHVALARIYSYFGKLTDDSSRLLGASLESLAYQAADELLKPRYRQECGGGRTWFDSTALWALCENFGPGLKDKVLNDMSTKVEELFHGKPGSGHSSFTFSEWGMCTYLITKLDPYSRQKVLSRVNSVLSRSKDRDTMVPDEGVRKRLLNSGLPLALLGLA